MGNKIRGLEFWLILPTVYILHSKKGENSLPPKTVQTNVRITVGISGGILAYMMSFFYH